MYRSVSMVSLWLLIIIVILSTSFCGGYWWSGGGNRGWWSLIPILMMVLVISSLWRWHVIQQCRVTVLDIVNVSFLLWFLVSLWSKWHKPAWKLPLTYIGIIEVNCINISCDFLPLTTCSKLLPSFLYSKSLSFLIGDILGLVIKWPLWRENCKID